MYDQFNDPAQAKQQREAHNARGVPREAGGGGHVPDPASHTLRRRGGHQGQEHDRRNP